jgi:hypothetical protein
VLKIGQAARLLGLQCAVIEAIGHSAKFLIADDLNRLHGDQIDLRSTPVDLPVGLL